ncbi:MAG: hypothetical protein HKN25_09720, partial [Pyrinomonadaceae bacterium]|nr:hypothetical protein [Pyrinomonadaceae bacterium]
TNTIHRGWNPEGLLRSVLISSFWREDAPLIDIELQDYKELNDPEFVSELTPETAKSVGRYIEAYEANQ